MFLIVSFSDLLFYIFVCYFQNKTCFTVLRYLYLDVLGRKKNQQILAKKKNKRKKKTKPEP